MKYVVMVFILISSLYSLSYAKYNWKKKNRMAAVGVIFVAMVSIILPAALLFLYRK